MNVRRWRARGVILVSALVIGCGDATVAIHPVTGKLTKGGKPLEGVMVTFTPVPTGPNAPTLSSSGMTNANGEFVLIAQNGKAGAMAGKHKVQLTIPDKAAAGSGDWSDPAFREKMTQDRNASLTAGSSGAPTAADAGEQADLIPREYADGEKTPLTYEVKAGTNSFDIPIP
jgi:hypothetical protein